MAQYVLLRFEDDNEAEAFIERTVEYPTDIDVGVVGQYKIPTRFCTCEMSPEEQKRTVEQRGKKYGWFLRPCCGKPSKYSGQVPVNILPLDTEAEGDPNFKDHVLCVYTEQNVGKHRRQIAHRLIEKDKEKKREQESQNQEPGNEPVGTVS